MRWSWYNRQMANQLKSPKELPATILKQIAALATSGFSLVAALAWNDLIRNFIDEFVKPYMNKGSGMLAQLVYAVTITILVVIVTIQLAWLNEKLEKKENTSQKR